MIDLLSTAQEQILWLNSGKISSVDLLKAYQSQWESRNPDINAVVVTDFEAAFAAAAKIDAKRKNGEDIGPLAGLPMTVKDTFDVRGMPAAAGDPKLLKRSPDVADAVTVARIKAAGGIIWGKTNTSLYAGDIQTYNKPYGVTNNPHDLSRTPGGSSGGSAAALAAGLTPLELGSDIGGSLRTPSHNCGTCAIKPSWGLIPDKGHVPPPPSDKDHEPVDLAVVGPMGRNIDDVALLMSILSPATSSLPEINLSKLKVGVWQEPQFVLSREVEKELSKLSTLCKNNDVEVSHTKPDIDPISMIDTYIKLLAPIVTANLPSVVKGVFRLLRFVAKRKVREGELSFHAMVLAATQTNETFEHAIQLRREFKMKCDEYFKHHDALIAPVNAVPAIKHDIKRNLYSRTIDVDGNQKPYTSLLQWISLANLCHLPAVVIPVGMSTKGIPIGVQIIGAEGSDAKVLAIAKQFETLFADKASLPNLNA